MTCHCKFDVFKNNVLCASAHNQPAGFKSGLWTMLVFKTCIMIPVLCSSCIARRMRFDLMRHRCEWVCAWSRLCRETILLRKQIMTVAQIKRRDNQHGKTSFHTSIAWWGGELLTIILQLSESPGKYIIKNVEIHHKWRHAQADRITIKSYLDFWCSQWRGPHKCGCRSRQSCWPAVPAGCLAVCQHTQSCEWGPKIAGLNSWYQHSTCCRPEETAWWHVQSCLLCCPGWTQSESSRACETNTFKSWCTTRLESCRGTTKCLFQHFIDSWLFCVSLSSFKAYDLFNSTYIYQVICLGTTWKI